MPLDPVTSSAIISGAASLVSGAGSAIIGGKLNKKNRDFYERMTNQQNAFNAEQAQLAYQRQRELYDYQFDKETAYNDPLAQVARMQRAGLNPALLSGSGAVDAGSVVASPSGVGAASAASANPPELQNYFQQGLDSMVQVAATLSQLKLNKSTRNKTDKEAAKVVEDTELSKESKNKVIQETKNLEYTLRDILPTQYKQMIGEIEKTLQDMKNSQNLTAAQVSKLEQDIKESISRVKVSDAQASKLNKELQGYSEYLKDVYRHEAYRADLDFENYEFAKNIRGLKTRFSESLQNGNIPDAMKYGILMYLMDLVSH